MQPGLPDRSSRWTKHRLFNTLSRMTLPQIETLGLLGLALVLFASGKLRHDLVALLGLVAALVGGRVTFGGAFNGVGHPEVSTGEAAVVVRSGLARTGSHDQRASRGGAKGKKPKERVWGGGKEGKK